MMPNIIMLIVIKISVILLSLIVASVIFVSVIMPSVAMQLPCHCVKKAFAKLFLNLKTKNFKLAP
jgi:hypothetical protein